MPERGAAAQGRGRLRGHRGAAEGESCPPGGKEFVGNKGCRKYLRAESGAAFILDEVKIKEEAAFDGHWVSRTNLADETEMIAVAYKQLWMVEDVFRTLKSTL